ncbi:thiolase family protein [bacterium]|nr:thiolase family protein [bacterium]
MREVVICAGARTAIGSFGGVLSSVPAVKLGAAVIKEAIKRAGVSENLIEEVYMGMVLQAGTGQAPARQAAIYAGVPAKTPCTTIHKVCGSGMKSVMIAAAQIALGEIDIAVAGGMENMSQSPHALLGSRDGFKMGNTELVDLMIKDGLWDPYHNFHMGSAAEMCADKYGITRDMQDKFAISSYQKAQKAISDGVFISEITPIEISTRKGVQIISEDEEPLKVNFDKISSLKPVFKKDGTVTAANASSLNDGAAALVLASKERALELGLPILGTLKNWTSYAHEPEWFTTAPAFAIEKLLKKSDWNKDDVEIFELNEAFSVQSLAVIKEAQLNPDKININGGAVALGHPIGASGARIIVTMLYQMIRDDLKKGVASLCIGGGEATAISIER